MLGILCPGTLWSGTFWPNTEEFRTFFKSLIIEKKTYVRNKTQNKHPYLNYCFVKPSSPNCYKIRDLKGEGSCLLMPVSQANELATSVFDGCDK